MKTVLISGAGIIGLATALELATQGVEVTVLERGLAMQEASWAAAGMLAADDPENPPALAALAHLSLSMYPEFLRRVEQLSGHSVPLRTTHTLQVCGSPHADSAGAMLDMAEAARRIPGLHPMLTGSLLWLDERSLDPRDLCRALPVAARAAGVRLLEHSPVESIHLDRAHATALTPSRDFTADGLILCNGAWSHLHACHLCLPRKGQMLAVRMPQHVDVPPLKVVLRSPEIYLVPRGEGAGKSSNAETGRIIIGATVEDSGFDRASTPEATAWLLEKAAALWPPIRAARVEDVWTGIRPGTTDGLPLIGPVKTGPAGTDVTESGYAEASRLWLATGHYRNGILLAPGTARVIASSLLPVRQQRIPIDLTCFSPARLPDGEAAIEEPQSMLL